MANGVFQVAKVALAVGAVVLATDKVQKEYSARKVGNTNAVSSVAAACVHNTTFAHTPPSDNLVLMQPTFLACMMLDGPAN